MLDIGPGAGKYGALMGQLEKSREFKCHKLAVEVDGSYVDKYGLDRIYDEIWVRDASNLVLSAPDLTGDLVMLGDVIEHLPKSLGIDLIEYLLYRFRHLIVIFPINLSQGAWEGHVREAHVSLWYPEDFKRYGATYCVADTSEGWNKCLVLLNGVFLGAEQQLSIKTVSQPQS